MEPLPNGTNGDGRDHRTGRFLKGCKGGPGNPDGKRAQAWRQEFLRTVTPAHVRAVARTLVRLAVAGEPWAVRVLLNRCLGRPCETLHLEVKQQGNLRRVEELLGILEKGPLADEEK
jgi:hypothetical protein